MTIVFSPWVDIRTNNPAIEGLQKKDPFLYAPSLRIYADYWTGDLDPTDYRVSPMFGDTSILKNVTVFAGTREIFYPDVMAFYEKIKGNENCRLIVGEGMNHVYPLFPIPEAKAAVDKIASIIGHKTE